MSHADQIHHVLKSKFGYDTFRPPQEEIILRLLENKDALVIMPTGGGKSLCYQLPALMLEGMTLVISPLISLMEDQVRALREKGIAAAAQHSGTEGEEAAEIHRAIQNQQLKILYLSPERAVTTRFLEYIRPHQISLIAIDEAHCVSIWGNDFRPEYAQLKTLTSMFPDTPVIALTATADKATQQDILHQLKLTAPKTFLSSFERKNIFLSVRPGMQRLEQILDFANEHKGEAGIIYCLARKTTESIAAALQKYGYKAAAYHAEIDNRIRKKVQEDFQFDRLQIVVATIAFGMGIDKPNIRWIIHYNLPKNIENYYQEIGRSGRDGMPAQALMFYTFNDIKVYREFIEGSDAPDTFKEVQRKKLERIWEYSQATSCRTNVILNYFGEYRETACGHCDYCINPPQGFDGTKLAQMALSACKRCQESAGIGMLVDVLRGSGRREVYDRGFQKIKTYGAGREYSFQEWTYYITQMINQGLLEIDYTQNAVLKSTPLSDAVLFDNRIVSMHKLTSAMTEPKVKRKSKTVRFSEALVNELDKLTKQIASKENVPPFVIFPKGTLKEMSQQLPYTLEDLSNITGVGEHKAAKYGQAFVDAIRSFVVDQEIVKKPKGATYLETLNLFHQGMNIDEMARARGMASSTIAGHLARLYTQGEPIDLRQFLTERDLQIARQGWRASGFSDAIGKIREEVGDSIDYAKLNLAIAILRKEEPVSPQSGKL